MLSLRSIIMIFLLLAMQPMAMPSLMSANYTRPSTQVSSLANENIVSTVDFVGTAVEMESTGIPSFSLAEFIMSIDYELVKAFAQDFSKKYEAFAEAFTDAMSAIFEFFSMEYNAYKQSINYESINAFAQLLNEKYEAFAEAFTDAMSAIFEFFSMEYNAYKQSINYESTNAFAQVLNEKYEGFAQAFTDAMSAIFEFFSMEYNAYKQSINYESTNAFAQDFNKKYEGFAQAFTDAMSAISAIFECEAFHHSIDDESVMSLAELLNEQYEAYAQAAFTAMYSKLELFIQKLEAYNQESHVEYQRVYKKLEDVASDLLAAAPAWPSLLDPEFIVRDVFDGMQSYTTKDPFVPAPLPPLPSLEDAQSIAAMEVVLDSSITFGAIVIALLLVATVTTIIYASSVIDRELISMEDLSIVLETPCLSMTD
ncbi:unnamed protein product, partial [Cylindrotheca closterium]